MNGRPPKTLSPPAAAITPRELGDVSPRLLRRSQAARYLGISTAQLDVLRLQGQIAVVRMPGRNGEPIRTPLYDRLALDRAIERWEANGASDERRR